MPSTAFVSAFLLSLVAYPEFLEARSYYKDAIPNGNAVPHPEVPDSLCPGVGHVSCMGGGDRNAFGQAFEKSGMKWADVCHDDSDNDGFTNGQELGDPCCVWQEGDAPMRTTDISHPGFPESSPSKPVECAMGLNDATQYPFYNEGEMELTQIMTMNYTVPDIETDYVNFPFNLGINGAPLTETLYLVGWEVDIQHYEHVHHFIGYFCPAKHDSLETWSMMEKPALRYQMGCEVQALAWAPGANRLALPGDVALPVGPGTDHVSMIIEVHYDNPDGVSGVFDSSSLILRFTDKPRKHDSAFLDLGDIVLSDSNVIPAGKESWSVSSRCLITTKDSQPISAFAHLPHMHWNGIRLWTEKIASGGGVSSDGKWEFGIVSSPEDDGPLATVARTDTYDADLQISYDFAKQPGRVYNFNHGDLMSTTCVYNTKDKMSAVKGGLGSQDEMCIHYFMYYPAGALDRASCYDNSGSIAMDWPQELSSVQQIPKLLSQLLTPNPSLSLGYDSTTESDEEGNGCGMDMLVGLVTKCEITDMQDWSQWINNPFICDESTDCHAAVKKAAGTCMDLQGALITICGEDADAAPEDCSLLGEAAIKCGITDPENIAEWSSNPKVCDASTECYTSVVEAGRTCADVKGVHDSICKDPSGCPKVDDMDCDWEGIMTACEVTDLEDDSQWTLEKVCNPDGACYPTFSTCGYMRSLQITECEEPACGIPKHLQKSSPPSPTLPPNMPEDQVKTLYATAVFPDLDVSDFNDALINLFKMQIAEAAGIPKTGVLVLEIKAGSTAVDWAAAFPADTAGKEFSNFEAAVRATPEIVFYASDFGSKVEVIDIETKSENFGEFLAGDDSSAASFLISGFSCLLMATAAGFAALLS